MSRILFKTMISTSSELPFIKASIVELYDLVDLFIICESNYTHTGKIRNSSLASDVEKYFNEFQKIKYIQKTKN